MIIAPQQDYPLSKNITALEAYMFMTTEKLTRTQCVSKIYSRTIEIEI